MRWIGSSVEARSAALLTLVLLTTPVEAAVAKSARALYQEAVTAEKRLRKSTKLQSGKNAWYKAARRYHRVVLEHPQSGYCDDALWYEGELYREAAERFRSRQAAVKALDAYRLLAKGYPASKWCGKARLKRADLLRNRFSNLTAAKTELQEILSAKPKSDEAKQARRLLARWTGKKSKTSSGHVVVRNIRKWVGKDYTRIVIDMDEQVKYRQFRLTSPDRIYFDLYGTRLSESLPSGTFPVGDGFLKQIRVGQNQPDVVRVVFDFDNISRYNAFSLHNPYRLVVDILGIQPDRVTRVTGGPVPTAPPLPTPSASSEDSNTPGRTAAGGNGKPAGSTEAPAPEPTAGAAETATGATRDILLPLPPDPTADGKYPLTRQLGLAARRVVIDPGHGGHDPGTMARGLKEKDLTLDISRRVAQLLNNDGEFEVLMTRNRDTFIPLEERTAIANSKEADLFVSIHVNAHRNRRVRGIETFYLNLATTPDAEQTAARENAVSTRRMSELQEILRQIMNNSKIMESGDFAYQIQESMVDGVLRDRFDPNRDHGVKTAPFYVLLGANMPAALVEVSFLSNKEDARLLSTEAYRQRIAEAIAEGIREYTSSLKKVARVPAGEIFLGPTSAHPNPR